ncbi:XFP N-terminal domain-containing protein [Lipomyces starkeyi]
MSPSLRTMSPSARATLKNTPLSKEEAKKLDDYMLYLKQNPLLQEPLKVEHLKSRLLGHWGSDAGQIFTYIHFNRLIKKYDLDSIFISGPGHGAPAVLSQAYLEGTYSDVEGMRRFFKQFSFPGVIGSHATPETPGSLHEGGELGYSILHAFGAVFDNPDLIALTMVGDGESETGPLATSWHFTKFLNPITDGAVLPVCISMATRSIILQSSLVSATKKSQASSSVTVGRHISSSAATWKPCIKPWLLHWRNV